MNLLFENASYPVNNPHPHRKEHSHRRAVYNGVSQEVENGSIVHGGVSEVIRKASDATWKQNAEVVSQIGTNNTQLNRWAYYKDDSHSIYDIADNVHNQVRKVHFLLFVHYEFEEEVASESQGENEDRTCVDTAKRSTKELRKTFRVVFNASDHIP